MRLRERCAALLQTIQTDAMLRQHSPVETLMAFVVAEIGRAGAKGELEEALPLCLYFVSNEDRDEFIATARKIKPGMMTRKLP